MSRGGTRLHKSTTAGAGADSSRPAETLGALASVFSIWVVTAALVYLAAARIISNDYEIEARAMLATSASAVGLNLVYVPHRAVRTRVPWSHIPLHTPSLSPGLLCPCPTYAHGAPRPPGHLLSLYPQLSCPQALPPPVPCPLYTPAFQPVYVTP